MHYLLQLVFISILVTAIWLFTKKAIEIRRNILLGKDEAITGNSGQRLTNLLLLAFGQKKMFKNPLVAFMHFVIYAGFIIINIELLEIIVDGVLGTHRLFYPLLGKFYPVVINIFEILAAGIIIVCVIFLLRRNLIKVKRFTNPELDKWPRTDANIILISEIVLMTAFLTMNAADRVLQFHVADHYRTTGSFFISGYLSLFLDNYSLSSNLIIERSCWWIHITGVLAFLNYLPYSKHLHIILAFPNSYYTRLEPAGKMNNMVRVQNEVKYMMQPETAPTNVDDHTERFGAKDIFDLSRKNLLDAYSCTECGRCTAACPANQTGKLLSPRKIMMDTRDRTETVGKNINLNGQFKDDGKSLLDLISIEELRACTTCNACVEECPVSISPMEIILQLRRYLVMEESNAPQEWNSMFSNIENNFAPWKFSPDDRDKWVQDMS